MRVVETGKRVLIMAHDFTGVVKAIRHDSVGAAILTVMLDNPADTPDGLYLAREFEVVPL